MRMYFRTNYHVDVDIFTNDVIRLQKGNTYEVVSEIDDFYFIEIDNDPLIKILNIVAIPKEDLEDDVYVVTGKSEKLEKGGGAI